jgi:cytochrome c oxidase subunit 2
MKSFIRYCALIVVTAVITGAIVFVIGGSPADAQPAPAPVPAGSAAAAAPAAGGAGAAAPAAPAPADIWYTTLAKQPIDEDGNFWMPKAVNLEADSTDQMFYAVWALSAFFFLAITAAVVYLVIKYRHRPGHKAQPSASHNDALEITWTIIPTIISVFLFYYGWRTYVKVVTPPTHAIEINVIASKWEWKFIHSNGAEDSNLHVPVGVPVRLVMTSTDVLHAFYAPVMRVKQDVIPRRYTYAWFKATKPGTYRLTCAEYCGTNHSQMACKEFDKESGACLQRAVVVVHRENEIRNGAVDKGYAQYLADNKDLNDPNQEPAQLGAKVYAAQCVSCHTTDGTPRIGPTFKGNFGTPRKMSDGSEVVMDENYIRESLMTPNAKVRAGFPASMTPFEGKLKEKEITGLIEYIKSLK